MAADPHHAALPLLVTAEWLSFAETLNAGSLERAVLTAAEHAAAAGFSGLEIPLPHAEPVFKTHGEAFWARMSQRLASIGIPIRTIHGPTFAPLGISTEEAIERIQTTALVAAACEAEVIVVHPTPHTHPHVTPIARELLKRDIEVCHAVADTLTGPTRLAVENLPTYGIAHLERLMERVTHPRIGVCFDTGHWSVRPEGSIEQAIERFADRIIHWHLSDNDGWTDQHAPPGQGSFPWARWSAALAPSHWSLPMLIELSAPLMRDAIDAPKQTEALWHDALQASVETLQPLAPKLTRS